MLTSSTLAVVAVCGTYCIIYSSKIDSSKTQKYSRFLKYINKSSRSRFLKFVYLNIRVRIIA